MHFTLVLATFVACIFAAPIVHRELVPSTLMPNTHIDGCFRAGNGRRDADSSHACRISHPRDISHQGNDDNTSQQPTELGLAYLTSSRREVDLDDRVVIKARSESKKVRVEEENKKVQRSAGPAPIYRVNSQREVDPDDRVIIKSRIDSGNIGF